jgi:hypothetical protein
MGIHIEDGKGRGFAAAVNGENRVETSAVTKSQIEAQNGVGKVWSFPLDAVAPSGATYFFYLLNTSEETIELAQIVLASSAAGVFRVEKVTGTPVGGSAVTAVPLNFGSSLKPDATILTGTSITGLTTAGAAELLYLKANEMIHFDPHAGIYLPNNTGLAIKAPGAATINGTLLVYID